MSTQPQPVDLSLSEGHTPGPCIWIYPEGFDGPYYEGQLPRIESGSGACVAAFGDSTQYYPTEGETPEAADRELIASAPAMRSELVRLRERVRTLESAARGGNALNSTADLLEFLADRLCLEHGESKITDYIRCAHERAGMLRAALSQEVSDEE